MTREASRGDTKDVQEYAYGGEIEVDDVVRKVIQRRKYYNTAFKTRVIIPHKYMN